jgi:hypothetical protein
MSRLLLVVAYRCIADIVKCAVPAWLDADLAFPALRLLLCCRLPLYRGYRKMCCTCLVGCRFIFFKRFSFGFSIEPHQTFLNQLRHIFTISAFPLAQNSPIAVLLLRHTVLPSPYTGLVSTIYCPLVYCLLSAVYYLLSTICYPATCYLLPLKISGAKP